MESMQVYIDGSKIKVSSPIQYKDVLRMLPCAEWNPSEKVWQYPTTPGMAEALHTQLNLSDQPLLDLAMKSADFVAAKDDLDWIRVSDAHAQPEVRGTDGWKHQLRAYHFAYNLRGAMLAMDMGTGKSKVTVDLIQNRDHRSVLIMCPKSVIGVWPREFERHAKDPDGRKIIRLDQKSTAKKLSLLRQKADLYEAMGAPYVVVVNHEAAWRGDLGSYLTSRRWDLIVVDESHRAKDPKGKFSNFLKSISGWADYRLCLTGTPMPHSPLDCFGQYRFLEPAIFGWNPHRFQMKFAKTEPLRVGGRTVNRVIGVKNHELLNEKFFSIAYRVTKEEALDLPKLHFIPRELKMSDEAAEIYSDIEDRFFAMVRDGHISVDNALSKIVRLRQCASGFLKPETDDDRDLAIEEISRHKVEALTEIIGDVDEPIVVFANFKHEIDQILEVGKAAGLRTGEITGRQHDLTDTSEMPEDIDLMAVMIQSGGVGIDLTRSALAIYYSPTFSLGNYDQSVARVHRPGQTRPTRIIQFMTGGTIEPVIYRALVNRRNAVEEVLEIAKNV